MPTITSIVVQQKNKKRCNLFIDGEFFCGISVEAIIQNRLKKDIVLTDDELQRIVVEGQKGEALEKALTYVSKTIKTKRQVKDYLLKKGYPEEVVLYVVDKLKEYGYVDDVEFSKRFIESAAGSQGRRLIEYKLMSKGVKKEDVASAYEVLDFSRGDSAYNVAQKYLRNKEKNKENIQKAYRYLIGRGFSYDEAARAVATFKETD